MSDARNEANVQQSVPFFWVSDIEESVRYYVDGLGFEKTLEWVDGGKLRWCWLQNGGAALMLQEFWKDGPHANVPEERTGVGVSVAFICRDALSIYREVRARGIEASEPKVGNGMWVTEMTDPDGYWIFFESVTDEPEETTLSEWEKRSRGGSEAGSPASPP
jgi:lactoylglutathione lyase